MSKLLQILVSSVEDELTSERRLIRKLIEENATMRESFSIVRHVDITDWDYGRTRFSSDDVDDCDIYIGLLGTRYDATNDERSDIEIAFDKARAKGKTCLIFVKGNDDRMRERPMQRFLRRVETQMLVRRFKSTSEFKRAVKEALSPHLEETSHNDPELGRTGFQVCFGRRRPYTELRHPTILFSPLMTHGTILGCELVFTMK